MENNILNDNHFILYRSQYERDFDQFIYNEHPEYVVYFIGFIFGFLIVSFIFNWWQKRKLKRFQNKCYEKLDKFFRSKL